MLFYFFARLEFYLWNIGQYQGRSWQDILWAFVVGMRFDVSAVCMLMAPLLLLSFMPWGLSTERSWRRLTLSLFLLLQIPFLIFNLGDVEFINFVGRRFSFDGLFILKEVQGKVGNFLESYWLLFFVNTLLVLGLSFGAYWILFTWKRPLLVWNRKKQYLSFHAFACFVALVLAVVGIRGGLQKKPLNFTHAGVFAAPILNNLILNSTFTFIKSIQKENLKRDHFFANEEMMKNLNGAIAGPSVLRDLRFGQKQNVVIIILESFSSEYVGVHNGKSFTPFLDSLMAKSLVFKNAYANGRRSIEGVAAVMAGIPALMNEPFISSPFVSNYFLGLGTLLGQQGYHTSFFHGANNGSMYFDSFMQSAGVEHYYGAQEFPDSSQHDGVWGIWDEPFLQFMAKNLNEFPQPFMSSVFTLTSHQPYKVPAAYKDLPSGELPILKSIAYTDTALKNFFTEIEKKGWYRNTLFVIMADHTGGHYLPEYKNDWGDYHIPLILFHPQMPWEQLPDEVMEKLTNQVVQQIDVLPTVLDILNIEAKDKNFLGSSVFAPGDKTATLYLDNRYLLVGQDYFLKWAPGADEPTMFARKDLNMEKALGEPQGRKEELQTRLKAAIQYFSEGMWDNKLYYPGR